MDHTLFIGLFAAMRVDEMRTEGCRRCFRVRSTRVRPRW